MGTSFMITAFHVHISRETKLSDNTAACDFAKFPAASAMSSTSREYVLDTALCCIALAAIAFITGHAISRSILRQVYTVIGKSAKASCPVMFPVLIGFNIVASLPSIMMLFFFGGDCAMLTLAMTKPFMEEVFYRRGAAYLSVYVPISKHASAIVFAVGHAWTNTTADAVVGHHVVASWSAAYVYQKLYDKHGLVICTVLHYMWNGIALLYNSDLMS